MLAASKREKERGIDGESADKFSCEDLRMIDREWLAASDGKFGFSVQWAIYKRTGNAEDYSRFGDAVGWRANGSWKNYHYLAWSTEELLTAPEGHLPISSFVPSGGWIGTNSTVGWWWFFYPTSPAVTCGL